MGLPFQYGSSSATITTLYHRLALLRDSGLPLDAHPAGPVPIREADVEVRHAGRMSGLGCIQEGLALVKYLEGFTAYLGRLAIAIARDSRVPCLPAAPFASDTPSRQI